MYRLLDAEHLELLIEIEMGSAAARLDRLDGVAEPPPAARDRIVHHLAPFAEALEPAVR